MFERLDPARRLVQSRPVTMMVDGRPVVCRDGDTVAAALLAAGMQACRETPVRGTPRGPFCMMGVCFDCLVAIDGQPNQQGCMVVAREGMVVQRQHGARTVPV